MSNSITKEDHLNKQYKFIIFILMTFLVILPKGGIKIIGIPITWGFITLGIITLIGILFFIPKFGLKIPKKRAYAMLLILPFQLILILYLFFNGYTNIGYTVSLVTNLILLPWIFILILGAYLDKVNLFFLFRMLKTSIFLVSIYGITLFIYKMLTGDFFEIPYLTVNIADYNNLDDKYIDRGGVFKLISTYNNGNIYGISLLILLPLYCLIEDSKWKKIIVKSSIILTLSRTVWIGLILYELFSKIYIKKIRMKSLLNLIGVMFTISVTLYVVMIYILKIDISWLFDNGLGNRSEQLNVFTDVSFISSIPFYYVLEMMYFSILNYFGIVGLILFILALLSPLIIYWTNFDENISEYRRALASGLIIYLIIAVIDGALSFIPVMVFYWFISALLISENKIFIDYQNILKRKDEAKNEKI